MALGGETLPRRNRLPWNVRPAVLRPETVEMLDDDCSFRHGIRNIYSMNLKFDRVEALAVALPQCLVRVREDLQSFVEAAAGRED